MAIEQVEEPVWAGSDADDALLFFSNTGLARGLLQNLDDAARASAIGSLKETMVERETADGVEFGSAAWLITAQRRSY
ncbi:MAG: hypothetical protein H0U16_11535 [Actinobacteria bacterium]|nr:hypothetical protein [Actinomycetota bacterium]